MAVSSKYTIDGADSIQKVLQQLPVDLQKKALDNAMRAGAKIIADEAKNQAESKGIGDGGFAESITVVKPTSAQGHGAETVIVIALKKAYSRLAHIFEYGTGPRYRKSKSSSDSDGDASGGGYTGQIIAKPFMRPALDIKGSEAIKTIAGQLQQNIVIIVMQLSSRQKISLRRKR
jgi:HK97 gp10 family phage protein